MDDAAKFSQALTATLYAAQKNGANLKEILASAKEGIISNSLRPLPQDQDLVIKAIAQAIKEIDPPAKQGPRIGAPGGSLGQMPCPDCNKGTLQNGEECDMCNGTGKVERF